MTENNSRVLLITGGTGSIGSELARHALAQGWTVIVQGSKVETVNALVTELRHRNGDRLKQADKPTRVAGVVANINTPGAVDSLIEEAANLYGRIDAVIDCLVTGPAQGGITGPFENTNPDSYLPFAALSIVYLEQLMHASLPFLKASRGCFITLVSDAGLFPAPRQAVIGAARAAAINFIKNIALEIAPLGVRANCVSLSYVENTRSFEKLSAGGFDRIEKARKRAGLGLPTAKDIVPLLLFLCGPGANKLTGQVISINGGVNS